MATKVPSPSAVVEPVTVGRTALTSTIFASTRLSSSDASDGLVGMDAVTLITPARFATA